MPPQTAGMSDHLTDEENPPFWKPSLGQSLAYLGWKNLYFLPAAALLAVLALGWFYPHIWLMLVRMGFKVIATLTLIPMTLAGYGASLALKARKDPFCIHCGHCLLGLPERHICPECGRPYDLDMVEDYRRDRKWFIERFRARRKHRLEGMSILALPSRRPRSRDGV